ncbi:MAG: MFS transporter [Anaerolineae bacterium]
MSVAPRVIHRLRDFALWQPLEIRNFRLLWLGESVSLLGDQFHFVALAWLTLQITGSGLALGTVMMAASIPRAVFMLLGGVLSDWLSPRRMMLVSNAARALVVATITGLILFEAIQLWHLYVLAVVFGLVDAFFHPAFMTIVPGLVGKDRLEAGNALLQGTAQVSVLVGPAPAGLLISAMGIPIAFAVDAVTFAFATLTLWLMREGSCQAQVSRQDEVPDLNGLADSIGEGLRYAWGDPVIRAILFVVAAVDFSFVGPFTVGLASLADHRFAGGAVAFGTMLSMWGGGALLGTVVAGSIGQPRRRGKLLLSITAALGVGLSLLGIAPNVVLASVVIGAMGLASGFVNVVFMAWLQRRTDPQMLGRVMSLVMLASLGLAPLSYALAGALADLHATIMFVAAGAIVLVASLFAIASRPVRSID